MSLAEACKQLEDGKQLTATLAETAMAEMLSSADPAAIANYLTLTAKAPITADVLAGSARAMRAAMRRISAPPDAVDVCGTGGDGSHSLNISTAVALVLAGAGVKMAKHGNRSITSRSGSADVLAALGVATNLPAEEAEAKLHQHGIVFLMAPEYHPALARISPIRKQLGFRTIFNILGPMCNPAGVTRQLIGVYSQDLLEPVAKAMVQLGSERLAVVHGTEADGSALDELSITGQSQMLAYAHGRFEHCTIQPEDAGIPRSITPEALKGGDATTNAKALLELLSGKASAYRDAVILNSAAALIVAEKAQTLEKAAILAASSIDNGKAKLALMRLTQP